LGRITTSTNGVDWTAFSDTGLSGLGIIYAIAYGDGKFVIGGNSGGKIAYSSGL
jgi:hypothetical protein